ncbi:hypothetical protein BDC45DRAFT_533000 [Circinella umbellata]|nr:hypothetical protein BDC45DRAFT_533000 [Circinella umbellata]
MPYLYSRIHFIIAPLQIKDRVQDDPFRYGLLLHRNWFLIYDLEAWELYDEIHRWQRVKLPVRMKQQIAQIYFKERIPKINIATKLNVSRRAVCRVLAEWNEIGRVFHLLESCLWINGYNANKEIYIYSVYCIFYKLVSIVPT